MKQKHRDFLLLGDSITMPLWNENWLGKKKKKNLSPLIKTQSHTVIMVVTEKIFPSILDKEKTGRRAKNKPKLKCAQAWKI